MNVLLWFLCIHRCTDVQHILNEHKCRNVTKESVIHLPEGPFTQAVFDVIFAAISTGFFVMPSAATPNYTCKAAVISVWFSGTCNFSVITGRFQRKQLTLLTIHVYLHWYKIFDNFIMCHCKSSHIRCTWTLKLQLVAVQNNCNKKCVIGH